MRLLLSLFLVFSSPLAHAEPQVLRDLSRQVVQNQIYIEGYKLDSKVAQDPKLKNLANKYYNASDVYKQMATVGLLSGAGVSGSVLQMALRGALGNNRVSLTNFSTFSAVAVGSSAAASWAAKKSDDRQNEAARLEARAAIAGLEEHVAVVGDFFALNVQERQRFESALVNEIYKQSAAEDEIRIDSIAVLLRANIIEPELAAALKRWRAKGRISGAVNQEGIRAQIVHVAWTSSVIRACLDSKECRGDLTDSAQVRLRSIVKNSDARVARVLISVNHQ